MARVIAIAMALSIITLAGCGGQQVVTVTAAAKPPARHVTAKNSKAELASRHYRECRTEDHNCQDVPQAAEWQHPHPGEAEALAQSRAVEAATVRAQAQEQRINELQANQEAEHESRRLEAREEECLIRSGVSSC